MQRKTKLKKNVGHVMFIWKWALIGHPPNRKNTITYVIHATVRLKPLYQNHSQKNYCVQNVVQK